MKNVFTLLFLVITASCTTLPTIPVEIPKHRMPLFNMATLPEGTGSPRWSELTWLDCLQLRKDVYTENPKPEWGENFDALMDGYAKKIMSQPPGEHGIHMWHCEASPWINSYDRLIRHHDDRCVDSKGILTSYDCPWSDHGIKLTRAKISDLISALVRKGVTLDYFHTSNEQGWSNWGMSGEQIDAIWADPRFYSSGLAKQLDWVTPQGVKVFWQSDNGHTGHDHVLKFNAEMYKITADTFYKGLYEPVKEAYPQIKISDYAKYDFAERFLVYDFNGWELGKFRGDSNTSLVGKSSDLNYLGCGQLCTNGIPGVGEFPPTEWNRLILSLNQARGIALTSPDKPFHPVLASKSWEGVSASIYHEHLLHLMLLNADALIYWNPPTITTVEDVKAIESAVLEADPYLGFTDKKTLETELIDWRATEIRTCAFANGKKVCRLTKSDGTGVWEQ